MDRSHRRRLSRRRVSVMVATCLIAAAAAVLVAYRPSLTPPGLHPREVQFSVAEAELLVDTPSSQLVNQAENGDLRGPPIQATYYTQLLQTDEFRQSAANAAGLRGQEITASGPFTLWDLTAYATAPALARPLPINANYRLLVDVDGVNPMITLYAQAPTTAGAVAIVGRARTMLQQYVASLAEASPVAPEFKVTLRSLGPITGGVVDPGARVQVMALAFVLVVMISAALALWRARCRTRRPVDGRAPTADDGEPEPAHAWPHTRRLLPWSLALFVSAIFLMPIESISLPIHLPFGSTPDRVLIVMMGFVWVLGLAFLTGRDRPYVRLTPIHFILCALFGVACLGIAVDGHTLAASQEVVPVVKKLVVLASLLAVFVIAASALRPGEVPSFLSLILGLGVIVAVAAIVESRTHFDVFYSIWGKILPVHPPASLDTRDNIGRLAVEGPTQQPLELATLLAMVLPVAIIRALDARSKRRRLLYVLSAALILGGAISTSRKTSVVAPAVGILVLLAYRPRPMLRGLLMASLPLFVLVHLAAPGQIGTTISELLPGHIDTVSTTTARTARYAAVRPDVMSHLLLGRGFESYDPFKYRILDNEYLGLLIGVGAIGLILYIGMFGWLFVLAHPTIRGPDPRRASAALAVQVALVMACVTNALFDMLSFSHVSYLMFILAAMTLALRDRPAAAGGRAPSRLALAPPARRRTDSGRDPVRERVLAVR